jgi:hypothetical protein|tara:strand:- start:95 stop:676 length:582 start_codon:yes stop_codon:yes gene_type:complete
MALKADRHELQTDISFFMNEVATRGGIAIMKGTIEGTTGGSGAAMDQSNALVTYSRVVTVAPGAAGSTAISGVVPVGMLLNDMVNLDLTRQHINWHKDEVQKGGKVTLLKKGWAVTDKIYPGETPVAGGLAYVSHSGLIAVSNHCTVTQDADDVLGVGRVVGRFLSTKDEDGYVKVEINLPNTNVPSADDIIG